MKLPQQITPVVRKTETSLHAFEVAMQDGRVTPANFYRCYTGLHHCSGDHAGRAGQGAPAGLGVAGEALTRHGCCGIQGVTHYKHYTPSRIFGGFRSNGCQTCNVGGDPDFLGTFNI